MLEQDIVVEELFVCPFCHGALQIIADTVICQNCGEQYPRLDGHQIDLRLRRQKSVKMNMVVNGQIPHNGLKFQPLDINPEPELDYSAYPIPSHLSEELVSYFPVPKTDSSMVLDIGCGSCVHKEILEKIGFTWVGLDYFNRKAPYLGDIQALPFMDEQFEFVMAIAMLNEIRFPMVALDEIYRVLKPGGKLVGTASFLEPYYDTTYCHFSHMGIYSLLRSSNFQIQRIAPSNQWDGLKAISSMALFPKLPRAISRGMIAPVSMLHRMWWSMGYLITRDETANEYARIRRISGKTDFVAFKPVK